MHIFTAGFITHTVYERRLYETAFSTCSCLLRFTHLSPMIEQYVRDLELSFSEASTADVLDVKGFFLYSRMIKPFL